MTVGHATPGMKAESATGRSLRRAEVLLQRKRAATARRRRGYALRLPVALPLILVGGGRRRLN